MTRLTPQQVQDEDLPGWTNLGGSLHTRIRTQEFARGLRVIAEIGAAAEELNHHPDLDLRYDHLDVTLTTHSEHGITLLDVRLARIIAVIAQDAGARLDPTSVTRLELGLDTPDSAAIMAFWCAVLAGSPDTIDDAEVGQAVVDPTGNIPPVWFQPSGGDEPRQHWHPDIWVDPAQVQPRIDAALKAGGTLFTDEYAPSFWVLADPQGNKVCLCTWQDRA